MNTILIVDDQPANLQVLSMMLRDEGYDVRTAESGKRALVSVEEDCPDLILLDVMMPGMNGYETCRQLKANSTSREIPVIFISALDNTQDKMSAFDVGGVDYITKPFRAREVIARVRTHVSLFEQKREIERLRQEDRIFYEKLNETRSQFLDAVTHDMKNPITVIRMYVELMRAHSRGTPDPRTERYLSVIEESADKLMELVTNILDLARIESGLTVRLQPVTVQEFMKTCYEGAEPLARLKGIQLVLEDVDPALTFAVDNDQLNRAVMNLLGNAVKYTDDGGKIMLGAGVEDSFVYITVADNGIGVPEADLPFLFDKFFRVRREDHPNDDGTGLGLSIVRAIIEQHNGTVTVSSEVGRGTTFKLRLPVALESTLSGA